MSIVNVKKILSGGVLSCKDLTVEEKKVLYSVCKDYGLAPSTTYNRFFQKGFEKWEIIGVSHIQDSFLLSNCSLDEKGNEEQGTRGYGYVLTLRPCYRDSDFYTVCLDLHLTGVLAQHMSDLGMLSSTTMRDRFKAYNWKPWELRGIRHIIELFLKNYAQKQDSA